jgi:hypothetical protein
VQHQFLGGPSRAAIMLLQLANTYRPPKFRRVWQRIHAVAVARKTSV